MLVLKLMQVYVDSHALHLNHTSLSQQTQENCGKEKWAKASPTAITRKSQGLKKEWQLQNDYQEVVRSVQRMTFVSQLPESHIERMTVVKWSPGSHTERMTDVKWLPESHTERMTAVKWLPESCEVCRKYDSCKVITRKSHRKDDSCKVITRKLWSL